KPEHLAHDYLVETMTNVRFMKYVNGDVKDLRNHNSSDFGMNKRVREYKAAGIDRFDGVVYAK
ncbi:37299_t:CDS:1, partial [Gigaspora margarita]